MTDYTIRPAGMGDAKAVGHQVARLLAELYGKDVTSEDLAKAAEAAGRLLTDERFAAYLALDASGEVCATLTLSTCVAVYAGGVFGEIAEFYVAPAHRSHGVGRLMVEAALEHARRRGWPHLEVGAPSVPLWQRSVDFYRACGFYIVGPRLHLDVPARTGG
jgi:GNAT superfamily N-acetyltransferase